MTKIGYARVSTTDQDLDLQLEALKAAGCDVVRSEKRSGTSTRGRDQLRTILDFIHAGDVLTITRIDRLARSIGDLQDIVRELKAKGATLRATEQPIDTSTAAGKAFLDMLGVFAEFETNLRRERQMEGIAAAKARGVYKGRPATIKAEEIAKLKAEGLGATEIAKRLGVGRASVYRVLAAKPKPKPTLDEYMAALRADPRFKVIEPSGKGFIIGGQRPKAAPGA
jgi:DNA invertase Pin-like site-specific DNA recombinase